MAQQDQYDDEYEDDFDPDDFEDDALPYVTQYSENAPHNLWTPMLAAGLVVLTLALGYAWYSLSSGLGDVEGRLASMPKMPPGLVEHEHPESERLRDMQLQIDSLLEQLMLQQGMIDALQEQLMAATQAQAPAPAATPATQAVAQPAAAAPVELPRGPGKWLINLGSFTSEEKANTWAQSLTADGYRVTAAAAQSGGKTVYRVRVTGLPDRSEAQRVSKLMQDKHDLEGIWVSREASSE